MSVLYSLRTIDDFDDILNDIAPGVYQGKTRPHKYLLFLTVLNLIEKSNEPENRFSFNKKLIDEFKDTVENFGFDSKIILPEYPYFHLRTSAFWKLKIKNGKENTFNNYISSKMRFIPSRINETIEYAYFDDWLFNFILNPENRNLLISKLKNIIKELSESEASSPPSLLIPSKFPHEAKALNAIISPFLKSKQIEFIPNYDLYDPSTNYYYECDLIAISQNFVAIIELKHWSGDIEISSYNWQVNGRFREDPHKPNKYKCQILKSFIEKEFPYLKTPWVESIVVFTNPDANIHNATYYKKPTKNPTFADIGTLIKFFEYKRTNDEKRVLTESDRDKIAAKLREQAEGPRNKTIEIPGYKILENITQNENIIDLLGRVDGFDGLEIEFKTVKRLRVFPIDSELTPEERNKQRKKSLNTLKVLDQVSSHPNLIKVEPVSNDEGLVIEVSNWSDNGTLADVIAKKEKFELKEAVSLIQGILSGLSVLHEEMIVHRDLRPENILMDGDTPKIMNFDYTYIPDDHAPEYSVLPDAKSIKPSPFIAPELYLDGQFSESTDLFSVGVIFYTLLCGTPPFKASLDLKQSFKLPDKAMAKLDHLEKASSIRDLIQSLVYFDRTKRPQEAKDVINILKNIFTDQKPKIVQPPVLNEKLKAGDSFSSFEIEEFVGKGREAQVYRAREIDDRKVAIKLFNHNIPKERIVAERRNLEQLNNPYILHFQTLLQWSDGRFFLVTNFVNGPSFRDLINQGKRPNIKQFRQVASCLFGAIASMHKDPNREKPLLHNDLKPDNILISGETSPVIIDFGTACNPKIGTYMGTELYVAPDLLRKVYFEFCESGDLFALAVTLFEWLCGTRPYEGIPRLDETPKSVNAFRDDISSEKLIEWFDQAIQPKSESRFADIVRMQEAFEEIWETKEIKPKEESLPEEGGKEIPVIGDQPVHRERPQIIPGENRFVRYLNTLHNATAEDENSLAESQAQNEFFGDIQIPLNQTDYIFEQLTHSEGTHVILTGHAGDGKSTIGLELYKKLKKLPFNEPLNAPLKDHEIVASFNGFKIHIIKDMSELGAAERTQELMDCIDPKNTSERWLIISNTGTMLSTFEATSNQKEENGWYSMESNLLNALSDKDPTKLIFFDIPFTIINIAQTDNIPTSLSIFEKILEHKGWDSCSYCDLTLKCPIKQNVNFLLEKWDISKERIKMVYRRLKEYGWRLTIRQICGHLAYSLTGGIDCKTIHDYTLAPSPPHPMDTLFSNLFFGYKGLTPDDQGFRIAAIKNIYKMELGSKPFPELDRSLWNSEEKILPALSFELQAIVSQQQLKISNYILGDIQQRRSRQAIRRLYYIFGDFSIKMKNFIPTLLDSPMLLAFEKWQKENGPSLIEKSDLKKKILYVLQEEYTGLQLGANNSANSLFISLRRQQEGYRQSVQILLGQIPFSNFSLEWQQMNKVFQPIQYILLLKDQVSGAELQLDLPFLDFVLIRDMGEVGQRLNLEYKDRLAKFKADLLNHSNYKRQRDEKIVLLQMNRNGELGTQSFLMSEQKLHLI